MEGRLADQLKKAKTNQAATTPKLVINRCVCVFVKVRDMTAMKYRYSPGDIPPSFDARDKWPGKIQVSKT